MADIDENKRIVRESIQAVWIERKLDALPDFWTADCVNHAMPGVDIRGLGVLQTYHESFFDAFAAFDKIRIHIEQQVAEGDRVVTHVVMTAEHTGPYSGIPPTGRRVSMAAIRIDRLRDGKIAEHWSVSDLAGLMQQLQA